MSLKNIVKLILLTILVLCLENVAYSQAAKQVEEISQPSAKQKDASIVAVNELSDLEGGEWAYNSVQQLVEKYDVLEGYPDGTFRGKKPSTRFELAAAVYDLATYFSDEIALDRDDLAKLAKLLDEFSGEIKTLQAKVDQLEAKVTVIDTRTTTLEGQIAQHAAQIDEHERRLAYGERRKGFVLERFIKGTVVDMRDLSRGMFAAVSGPFVKGVNSVNNEENPGNAPEFQEPPQEVN